MERIKRLILSQTIKDTSISFIGLGFTAVIGFVYTVILARILGPDVFGIFSAITALVAIVYSLGDLGIASALINFIPKKPEQRSGLINTAFWFEIFIGVLSIILFFILGIFHEQIIPGSISQDIYLAGFLAFNYLLIGFAQGLFTADRKFITFSFSQVIDSVVKILLVFVLLKFSQLSITTALLANITSTLLALIISFSKQLYAIKTDFNKHIFSQLFGFAKWIAVSKIFSVFISRIDIILLNILSSSYQAGIFAAANRITLFFALLVSSLGSVINPRFSSFDSKDKVSSYIKKLVILISGISLVLIVSVIFAKPIIEIVFGSKYLAAIPVYQVLTVSMIPFIFTLATTPAITYSFSQPSFIAYITAFQVILIVIIELITIPALGAFAPPIALGISNTITLIVSVIKLRQLFSRAKT